jgi:hypothetical protein
MNKYTQIVEQFKSILGMSTEVKMESISLVDGTVLSIDKMEVGGIAQLEDGSMLPNGEYETADMMVMIVGDNGVIESLQPKPEDKPAEEKVIEVVEMAIEPVVDERLNALETKMNELYDMIDKMMNMSKVAMESNKELQERLDKTAGKPLPQVKTELSTNSFKSGPTKEEVLSALKTVRK